MRSSIRRLAIPLAVAVSLGLVGAACSKSKDTTSTGSPGGSNPGGSALPKGDYSKLSGKLSGSGSTFQAPFQEEVINNLKAVAPNLTVNYGGGGSGKGKQELADQVVDFAGTDSLVKDADKAKYKGGAFFYFPTVAAPITVSYNVKGVDKLQLSPVTVAKIFQAEIKTWDDAAIKADNPGATLPSTAITVAHRSDGSGTTSTFTNYLKAAAGADWKLDAGDTVNWPANTQGGNGNSGVAQIVKSTDGAVGYVDFSDAKASGLSFAAIKNKAGKFVAASLDGASAAIDGAKAKDDLTYSALDTAGDTVYPITAATYVMVYQKQPDKAKGEAIKGYLAFSLNEGQALAAKVDYAKLPESMRQKALAQLDKLQIG